MSCTSYTLILDHFSKGKKSKTWIGHLKNHGIQYRAIITLNKNRVDGRISTPEGIMNLKSSNGEVLLMDYKLEGMLTVPYGNDFTVPEYDESLSYEQENISLQKYQALLMAIQ